MQVVILAGGLGTRMRPISETVPKSLLPIHQHPFAFYQLDLLRRNGVKKVVYSIGFLGEQIESLLGTGKQWGVEIAYCREGKDLKGTGGALRLAYDAELLEPVFGVLYGDSYLPIEYQRPWEYFHNRPELALMTVYKNLGQFDTSNARFEKGNLFYDKQAGLRGEKFDYIDYGFSIFKKEAIQRIPPNEKFDLAQLFHSLSCEKKLAGYEVSERFYEIGSPTGLKELESFLGPSERNFPSAAKLS
jgi:NDP-sugar pyrophosphorylase family protein